MWKVSYNKNEKRKHKSQRKSIVEQTNRERLGNIILFYFKQTIKLSHLTKGEKKTNNISNKHDEKKNTHSYTEKKT